MPVTVSVPDACLTKDRQDMQENNSSSDTPVSEMVVQAFFRHALKARV